MLEGFRARETAVLRDVPDQEHGDRSRFGPPQKRGRALPHLRDGPGRGGERGIPNGLDRVHDDDGRGPRLALRDHSRNVGLGEDEQPFLPNADPLATQAHLGGGFLPRDVEDFSRCPGDAARGLQKERGLADPGLPTEEHDRARHDAAAKDAVEARQRRFDPGLGLGGDRGDRARRRDRDGGGPIPADLLDVAVPLAAVRAAAEPLGRDRAAGLAGEDGRDPRAHGTLDRGGRRHGLTGSEPSRYLMSSSLQRIPAPRKSESALRDRFRKSSQPPVT